MGKVKELLPEDWDPYQGRDQEPDDLEMLQIDAERATERYQAALAKHNTEGKQHDKPF